jgi:hypothetical protein
MDAILTEQETIPKSLLRMDPKSTVIVRTLRGLPSNAAILSARPTLIYDDGSPAGFPQGMSVTSGIGNDSS